MEVRTRFAPSPTGYLHIGGARTALFNYLFAKHHGGKFLLRIEDTDLDRSTDSAKQAIINSMNWLNLIHDEEIIYQSERADKHKNIAQQLVEAGKAYYCFTPQEEIIAMREETRKKGEHFIFRSKWRDVSADEHPKDINPVVRLKSPEEGETVLEDMLQGKVVVQNSHLDDMILLRSDGKPTYMLAVIVDDHDMGITHIIRGDDHLSNAHRQKLIYEALGWDVPKMAHIPLIHGSDGAKLSKRHGALGVESYKEIGYLPDALNNYLLRLGWSHGDDEVISREDAIKWFGIDGMGKSPARLDFDKMKHMNAHYLRKIGNSELLKIIEENIGFEINNQSKNNLNLAVESIKVRAELVTDLCDIAKMYVTDRQVKYSDDAKELIKNCDRNLIGQVIDALTSLTEFDKDNIQASLKSIASQNDLKIGALMKYIRAFIAGRIASPSIFEMISILGKENSIARLKV